MCVVWRGGKRGVRVVVTGLQMKQWMEGTSRASAFLPCPWKCPRSFPKLQDWRTSAQDMVPMDPRACPADEWDNLGDKRKIPALTS